MLRLTSLREPLPLPRTGARLVVPCYAEIRATDWSLLSFRRQDNGAGYLLPAPQAVLSQTPNLLEHGFVKCVEAALRHLSDYVYLSEHPLAYGRVVQRRLPARPIVSLDRGKAVYDLLAEAIEKLCPPGSDKPPAQPPPRLWHPYLILHDAYLENTPNREIMCRLNISEGTFNRTRRAAVLAVAGVLEQMESE